MTGTPDVVRSAALVLVGAELLSGKVRDENLQPLSRTLRALGIRLERVTVIPDDQSEIRDEVRALLARFDVVFTSGGVGPTHDDVTIDGVAAALGVPVVKDAAMLALIERVYSGETTDAHRLMARVPEGARLVEGADVRWPTIVAGKVWIFPGVPQLFRMKIAMLREHMVGPTPLYGEFLLTTEDELGIKASLDEVVRQHPTVEVGSYPRWFDSRYRTRITFDSTDESAVRAARADMERRLGGTVVTAGGQTEES